MRYVADHTSIPVPHIYHWGTAADNPTLLHVPFIIMEHIPHATTIGQALDDSDFQIPSVPESKKREYLYQKMADISLQLYNLSSDTIGSLCILDDGDYAVTSAPLTHNIGYHVVNCSVPIAALPPRDKTYTSSTEYLTDVANMHVAALLFMNEKFTESAEDCRDDFVVRHLVRTVLRERQQPQSDQPREIFRLWGDDFRPESVLLDKDGAVVGVVDWEFTYFAPETFYYNPPWWLLIEAVNVPDSEKADSDAHPDAHSDAHSDTHSDAHSDAPSIADRAIPDQKESSCDAEDAKRKKAERYEGFMKEWHELVGIYQCALERTEEKLYHRRSNSSKDLARVTPTAQKLPLSQLMKDRWEKNKTELALTTGLVQNNLLDNFFWDHIDEGLWGENVLGKHKGRLDLLDAPTKKLMEWFVHRRAEEIKAWEPKAILDQVLEQMDGKSSVLHVQDDSGH